MWSAGVCAPAPHAVRLSAAAQLLGPHRLGGLCATEYNALGGIVHRHRVREALEREPGDTGPTLPLMRRDNLQPVFKWASQVCVRQRSSFQRHAAMPWQDGQRGRLPPRGQPLERGKVGVWPRAVGGQHLSAKARRHGVGRVSVLAHGVANRFRIPALRPVNSGPRPPGQRANRRRCRLLAHASAAWDCHVLLSYCPPRRGTSPALEGAGDR